MSSNISNRDVSVKIGSIIDGNSIDLSQSLLGDTLNIVGPSYKGPAFVPTSISSIASIPVRTGAATENVPVFNNIQNIIGTARQNRNTHLYDSLSYLSDNQTWEAANAWLSSPDRTQATFTRVLGIGSGKKNEEGHYIGSGFNVENKISRGSENNLTKTNNPQSIPNDVEGNLTFVFSKYRDHPFLTSYLTDLGLDPNDDNYFITKVIMCPDNVFPSFIEEGKTPTTHNEISEISFDKQLISYTTNNNVYLELAGLRSNEEDNDRNIISISATPQLKKPHTFTSQNGYSKLNYFYDRFLERGHIVYADFPYENLLLPSRDHKLLTTRRYNTLNNNSLPDFNSFESKYTTAKTPWVTSQPLNRNKILTDRQNIHKEVQNLFRFYSLDDGEVGNRFRIKINITNRGNVDTREYAKFDIYIFEYEARDNSFKELDSVLSVDLNPDSPNYIARLFGDEKTYYDIDNKKVINSMRYPRRNKYLRVEVHPDVEEKKIETTCIPSGFRAYHHLRLNADAFPDYSFNGIDINNIKQMPILYSRRFYEDDIVQGIRNNWGVSFSSIQIRANPTRAVSFYNNTNRNNGANSYKLSPHYFYTKYFLTDMKTESKNIWVQDDLYLNSFFHLEKIYYDLAEENLEDIDNDNLYYSRKGDIPDGETRSYINLDNSIYWDEDNTLIANLENKLSFDFFTYGGFDGLDIRDRDKRLVKNNGLLREVNGEDPNIDLNDNPLYNAYNHAIEIGTDGILGGDILVLPGVSNLQLSEKCINICEDKKNILFINNTINHNNVFVEDLTEIDDTKTYVNYFIDKEAIKIKESIVDGEEIESYKTVIDQNYFNAVSSNNTSLNSKYYFSIYGALKGTGNADEDVSNIREIDPTILLIHKLARTFSEKLSGPIDTVNGYSLELLNSRLKESNENWETDSKLFRRNILNVLYIPSNNSGLTLLSQNTGYEIRGSNFSQLSNMRKLNIIKKEIKYKLFTEVPTGLSSPVMFCQNSQLSKIYTILKIYLTNLFEDFKSRGLLVDYIINLPSEFDDTSIIDFQNYTIRGTLLIKLLNNGDDNNIINLKLSDIIKDLSILDNQTSIEFTQPTF